MSAIRKVNTFLSYAEIQQPSHFKKATNELQEIYKSESHINEITKNSKLNICPNWKTVLLAAQKLVVHEAKIFNNATTTKRAQTRVADELILNTANHGNNFIKRSDLLNIVLNILTNDKCDYYHNTYLQIVKNYLLAEKIEVEPLVLEDWKNLLNICINLFNKSCTYFQKDLLLSIMQKVVHCSCTQTTLLLEINSIFPFIENLLQDVCLNDTNLRKPALRLTYTLCLQIRCENRVTLCILGEKYLPSIINMTECLEKHQLILLFINIYYPNGKTLIDNAYCNNQKWRLMIGNIYWTTGCNIESLLMSETLKELTREVFKQVLDNPEILELATSLESSYQSVKKSQSNKISCILDLLGDWGEGDFGVALQILAYILKKYPECLKVHKFVPFLDIIKDIFLQHYRQHGIVSSLCDIVITLVRYEKEHKELISHATEIRRNWMMICTTILRGISINKVREENYKIVHHLVGNEMCFDVSAFLNPYVLKLKTMSPSNVETLQIVCENKLLTHLDDTALKKSQLLQWALSVPWQRMSFCVPINKLSKIITLLMGGFTNSNDICCNDNTSSVTDLSCDIFDEVETLHSDVVTKCHLCLEHDINLFDENQSNNMNSPSSIKSKETVSTPTKELDKKLLIRRLTQLAILAETEKEGYCLSVGILKIVLVMKVISDLKAADVIREDDVDTLTLINLIKESLVAVAERVCELDVKKPVFSELINIFESLNVLYSQSFYDNQSIKVILSRTTSRMLKHIWSFSSVNLENSEANLMGANEHMKNHDHICQKRRNEDVLYRKEILKISSIRLLTSYCCFCIRENALEIPGLKKVVDHLLEGKWIDRSSIIDVKIAIKMIETFNNCDTISLSQDILKSLIALVVRMFCKFHKETKFARSLLRMLPRLYSHAIHTTNEDKQSIQNLSQLFYNFHKLLSENKYGVLISLEFVYCLHNIIRHDHPLLSKLFKCENAPLLFDVLPFCLNSPFYAVRLETARCVHLLFSLKTVVDDNWKISFIKGILNDSWMTRMVNQSQRQFNTENEATDNKRALAASALSTITGIICSGNAVMQSEALLTMFKIKVEMNLDSAVVQKVLNDITQSKIEKRYIVENNINFLLMTWLTRESSFDTFPWALLDCSSQKQFYHAYIHILFPLLIMNEKHRWLISEFCAKLDLSFASTVEMCFVPVVSWLLSNICKETCETYVVNLFNQLKTNQEDFRSITKYKVLLEENVDLVLAYIMKKISDKDHLSRTFGINDDYLPNAALLDPPQFTIIEVQDCLTLLVKELGIKAGNLIKYLVTQCPSKLQKLITHLTTQLNIKKLPEEWLIRALQQYYFLLDMIGNELRFKYFDALLPYVVRDISYTLVHLIKHKSSLVLSETAGTCLNLFLKCLLPVRVIEMKKYLNLYLASSSLQLHATDSPVFLHSLQLLIVEYKDLFGDALHEVDPLSDRVKRMLSITNLSDKPLSLEEVIQRFLKNNIIQNERDINEIFIAGNLTYLKDQLSTKKRELKDMVVALEVTQGFTEDCPNSLLHRLIHRLVKFAESSVAEVRLEAVSCLGLLGLVNLNTMTLYPDKLFVQEIVDSAAMLTYQVVMLLSNLMIETDVELRKACSDATYDVFATSPDVWIQQLPSYERYIRDFEVSMKNRPSWHRDEFNHSMRVDLMYPFARGAKISEKATFKVHTAEFERVVDVSNDLWTAKSRESSYPQWLLQVCSAFSDCFMNSYVKNLIPVFGLSVQFCEETLPRIVYLLVRNDHAKIMKLCTVIDVFFCSYQDHKSEQYVSGQETFVKHGSVRCMLNIVNFLRAQTQRDLQLSVNYLKIAQAAFSCSAYFTATMCAESWCSYFLEKHPQTEMHLPVLNHIYRVDPVNGKIVQDIIRQTYGNIGIPDMIYNCSSLHCVDRSFLTQYYKDTQQWDKVMLMHDAELQVQQNSVKDMFNALQHLDLHHLLFALRRTVDASYSEVYDCEYESAWRLSDWDSLPSQQKNYYVGNQYDLAHIDINDYQFHHYKSLQCLHNSNMDSLQESLTVARESIIKGLRDISFESSTSVSPYMSELQMLQEIEEVSRATSPDDILKIHSAWQEQNMMETTEYIYTEPILHQRTVVLNIRNALCSVPVVKKAIASTYLEFMEIAKKHERLRIVVLLLDDLNRINDLPQTVHSELEFQQAHIIWLGGNQDHSRRSLRNLLRVTNDLDSCFRARCLQTCATWSAEAYAEHPQEIMKMFRESLQTFESMENLTETDTKSMYKARVNMARFADKEYLKIKEQMKSVQYRLLKKNVETSSNAATECQISYDAKVAKRIKLLHNTNDTLELENIEKQKDTFLVLAVECYAINLQQTDDYNTVVYRLVSLWLDNTNNTNLMNAFEKYLHVIPSYKFISLIPQLGPRMSIQNGDFNRMLEIIVSRCAFDHPYHTLPTLLALKYLFQDLQYHDLPKSALPAQMAKTIPATNLLRRLKSKIGPIINETEKLSIALIMLAYLQVKAKKGSDKYAIPRNQDIRNIKNFTNALVPTINIEVKTNAKYDNIVSVCKYEDSFDFVGGLNAPKKISCIGSDGIARPQLVKGRDDSRQDAMMQQIFSMINVVLYADNNTRKNKLKIRTYKIVPLSQRSGVLEWCKNTNPITMILTGDNGKSGVHKKYYPNDYTAVKCKNMMNRLTRASHEEKYNGYIEICQHFKPAFHHFFVETYQSPEIWFERKLAYTRSVAASSIIGYILGIGDRHPSNILFDHETAEVIHIDFGIAFEQGTLLPIPETVPFRLTRDIEAALGTYGALGTMKQSCEQTMTVLRQQQETIIMLLEVLLYDPIYIWATMPHKQNESSEELFKNDDELDYETNSLARKALWVIQQKLQGTEDGVESDVVCQIQILIHRARTPNNLCSMFCGWQPYL